MTDSDYKNILESIGSLKKRVQILEDSMHVGVVSDFSAQPKPKQISAKEFLLLKKDSSATEKTLALAYYLEHYARVGSFNIDDVARVFQAAREPSPANINDMINKNIAKGYIMEAPERKDAKKTWVLTATGEKFVENDLNN